MSRKLARQKEAKNNLYFIKKEVFNIIKMYDTQSLDIGLPFIGKGITLLVLVDKKIENMSYYNAKNLNMTYGIQIVNSNTIYINSEEYAIHKEDITICDGKIDIKNLNDADIKDFLIKYIYLLNFKRDYPYCLNNGVYDDGMIIQKVRFGNASSVKMVPLLNLHEFVINENALKKLSIEVSKLPYDKNIQLPYQNFNILLDLERKFLVNCSLVKKSNLVRVLCFHYDSKKRLFACNINLDSDTSIEILIFEELEKYFDFSFFKDCIDKGSAHKEIIVSKIVEYVLQMCYFYFNYSVKIKVEDVVTDEVISSTKNSNLKKNVKKYNNPVIVPKKRYIINEETLIKDDKNSDYQVTYTKKEWERAGHKRIYRNKDGSIKKCVFIHPTTCRRKKELSNCDSGSSKRQYVFDNDLLSSATNN